MFTERKHTDSYVYITGIEGRSFAWQSAKNGVSLVFTSDDVARFWAKVTRSDSESCWMWTASGMGGGTSRGYGQFTLRHPDGTPRKQLHLYAHRVSWLLANGPIPEGGHVLHSCDTPRCVNPKHLFLGDQDANMKDAAAKGRLSVPRPTARKITDAQVAEMFALAAAGVKRVRIADKFNVSKSFVSLVLCGKRRPTSATNDERRSA
jgi:hypothetical protein